MVGGLGLNPASTADAIARLPAAVSLGFAPYGDDLEPKRRRRARPATRCCCSRRWSLSPIPPTIPGRTRCSTGASETENLESLHWLMGRFAGYVGVVNYLGGKFTADARALTPVLAEIASRGLFYLDDGSSPRSLAREIAGRPSASPSPPADVVIDVDPTPEAIDAALTRLEGARRARGAAIGVATALPPSLERIARWCAGLEARGVALIPVSALTARSPGPAADAGSS